MLEQIFLESPILSISLTAIAYLVATYVGKLLIRMKIKFIPSIIVAVVLIVVFLKIFNISFAAYNEGAKFITYFSVVATITLALHIYRRKEILKKYYHIIFLSISVGIFFGFMGTFILAVYVFNFDYPIVISLLAKSITSPIAIDFTIQYGGIPSITILGVFICGTVGAVGSVYVYKIFRIKSRIGKGLGIGSSAHGLGTAYALQMGQTEGSMSSLALTIAAIISVIFMPLLLKLCHILFAVSAG